MKKKKASIGCLFWVALILLVLVIFAFNKNRIDQVMEATGFREIITQSPQTPVLVDESEQKQTTDTEAPSQREPQPSVRIEIHEEPARRPESAIERSPETAIPTPRQIEETAVRPDSNQRTESVEPLRNLRRSRLFFVQMEGDAPMLKGVIRPIYYSSSPLTDTLSSLLRGPSTDELNLGLISVIPGDSVINRIQVQNNTAIIDFSEAFRFNSLGREGYRLQLMQIVYTATEFPTVDAVQFLINGQKHNYLGPESMNIANPLRRSSF